MTVIFIILNFCNIVLFMLNLILKYNKKPHKNSEEKKKKTLMTIKPNEIA